jgi:hypothetical protein
MSAERLSGENGRFMRLKDRTLRTAECTYGCKHSLIWLFDPVHFLERLERMGVVSPLMESIHRGYACLPRIDSLGLQAMLSLSAFMRGNVVAGRCPDSPWLHMPFSRRIV